MWVESIGVVVRRYIYYLIPLLLLSVLFAAVSVRLVHFLNVFHSCSSTFL